MKSGIRLKGT